MPAAARADSREEISREVHKALPLKAGQWMFFSPSGKKSYFMGGAFNDGKGEPGQISSVSHGAVPARFKQVNVTVDDRKIDHFRAPAFGATR